MQRTLQQKHAKSKFNIQFFVEENQTEMPTLYFSFYCRRRKPIIFFYLGK